MSDLRPYYDPETFNGGNPTVYRPGLGVIDENGHTIASKIAKGSLSRQRNSINGLGLYSGSKSSRSVRNFMKINEYNENIKRNVYSDLEFREYFEWGNVSELLRSLLNSFVRNYLKCLISQPFEVARLLLQIGDFETKLGTEVKLLEEAERILNSEDEDDDDELNYFEKKDGSAIDNSIEFKKTRVLRQSQSQSQPKKSHSRSASQREFKLHKKKSAQSQYLTPVTLNTIDVMSSLLSTQGMRGLWRASNITFIYSTLSATLEAWITGFLSPFLQIPDPFFVDVVHSNDPTTTLILSLSASIITGLLLAPLDIIRTRLIVTDIARSERSIRKTIANLNYFTVPLSLVIPVTLNTLASTFFKKVTPYLLFVKFGIDSIGTPFLYSTISLISSIAEVFVKLPLETLLRRAQVHYLLKDASISTNQLKIKNPDDQLVVKFAGYSGLLTTLFDIYNGESENSGLEAVFRGWRVGVLNVIGSWGVGVLQSSEEDMSFQEEKF